MSVCGWVKTAREAHLQANLAAACGCVSCTLLELVKQADKGKIMFVQLNDGSTPLDIQVVAKRARYPRGCMPDSALQVVIDSSAKGFDSHAPGDVRLCPC